MIEKEGKKSKDLRSEANKSEEKRREKKRREEKRNEENKCNFYIENETKIRNSEMTQQFDMI